MLFLFFSALALFMAPPVYAGSSFSALSKTTDIIKIENAVKMDRIIEQIAEARKASQKALSKEEIEKLKQKADEVLTGHAVQTDDAGAMVFAGSQIIE